MVLIDPLFVFEETERREERKNGQCPNYDKTGIEDIIVGDGGYTVVAGLPGDAPGNKGLHNGLRHHHSCSSGADSGSQ